VYQRAVPNAHVVAYGGTAFLVGRVQNRAVLNIYFVANADKIHITAHHRLKPNGTLVAHYYITDNRGIFGQKTIRTKLGGKITTIDN
jgi:hypothetical protein